jgi:hypothetical protein
MMVLVGLIVAGTVALLALWLLRSGVRSGDQPFDPRSSAQIVASWNTDDEGFTCLVRITNPGQMVTIVSMDARWSSPLAALLLGPHDRRYATVRDRRRAESLATSHVGSVAPGGEAIWDLPLRGLSGRRPGAVSVVVLLSGGGSRVLRQIHRVARHEIELAATADNPASWPTG